MHGDGTQGAPDAELPSDAPLPSVPLAAAVESSDADVTAEAAEPASDAVETARASEGASEGEVEAAEATGSETTAEASKPGGATDLRSKNLADLELLCADLERVITIKDVKLKTLEKRLTTADNKYPKLLPLPAPSRKAVSERFQEARRKLAIRIGELKEAEEWKRWANVPKQEELIKTVEALLEGEPTIKLVDQLRTLQDQWKELGPAPEDKAQDLWARFKAGADAVYDRIKVVRAAQNVELEANLEKKRALCEQAEKLSDSDDWAGTAEALKRLQAEWKATGQVPRRNADAIWRRFRTACDAFFERRRPHLERAIGEKQANLDRKRAIVEFVEKLLAEATDLEDAAHKAGDARHDFKRVGQVPHKEFAELTERLNAASDQIFQRRDEARLARARELVSALETPVTEGEAMLEAAAAGQPFEGAELAQRTMRARAALRELEGKDAAAAAPMRARVEALTGRALELAGDAFKGTDLDPAQSKKRKEKLLAKIEALAPAPAAEGPMDMAAKLKAALADRALGGVLSRQAKGRENKELVNDARESWSRLGPVPGAEGEALEKRFAEACRRASGN